MKEIEKCKIEVFYQNGSKNIYETDVFFFTGEAIENDKYGMITMNMGNDLYDLYKILNVMESKIKDIREIAYINCPNFNEIFKIYDFINKNGIDNLKKEYFNITDEEFYKIKLSFGIWGDI